MEEQYNSKYQEELRRNILGSYEAGTLQICQQIYEQDLEKAVRERTESQKKWEADKETIRGQERRLEDKKEALIHKKIKIQKQTGRYQTYEKELEDRKAVLKYLDMEERYLLDRERILDVSGRKLRELEELRRNLEKEEDTLEKEYTGLTSGKVLELPEKLENELKNLDIHAVYGMEWLKKNGYSQKKNQELVRRNPFLPYALILTRQEMEKLGRNGKNICTSFPVPIVEREKLEEVQEKYADKIVRFPGISFYILFMKTCWMKRSFGNDLGEKAEAGKNRAGCFTSQKGICRVFPASGNDQKSDRDKGKLAGSTGNSGEAGRREKASGKGNKGRFPES